jgi:hypothetical protein
MGKCKEINAENTTTIFSYKGTKGKFSHISAIVGIDVVN